MLETLSFAVAFGATVCLVPIVRHTAQYWHMFDPGGPLKIHVGTIPRLGGIAITVAFLSAVIAGNPIRNQRTLLFVVGLLLVWLIGLLDDVRGLPASIRLFTQACSATLLYFGGWGIIVSSLPIINLGLTVILVLWFVNAFNFVDGSDGIASGLGFLGAFGYAVLFSTHGVYEGRTISFALLGCCLGFLLFNFPPATIFMGDSGSTVLGFVLARLALDSISSKSGPIAGLVISLLFVALPLADAVFAVIRRLRRAKSPFAGDRDHFYDLLLRRGLLPGKVAILSYLIGAAFVVVGLIGECVHLVGPAAVVVSVSVVVLALTLGSLTGQVGPCSLSDSAGNGEVRGGPTQR